MEDAATAEISRAQIWQWRAHGVTTQDDGQVITSWRISDLVETEVNRPVRRSGTEQGQVETGWQVGKFLCVCIAVAFVLHSACGNSLCARAP